MIRSIIKQGHVPVKFSFQEDKALNTPLASRVSFRRELDKTEEQATQKCFLFSLLLFSHPQEGRHELWQKQLLDVPLPVFDAKRRVQSPELPHPYPLVALGCQGIPRRG